MSVMTAPELWLDQDGPFTVDDLESLPDDEFRYELDDGVLIVSPMPSMYHQIAVGKLQELLGAACPPGLIVVPGAGINISRFQHRAPDVVVAESSSAPAKYLEQPPRLVVEVASPRTRLYDRNRKKDVYQGFGIPAYWIVEPDPDRPRLIVFELRDGKYPEVANVTGDEEFEAKLPFPVTIRPAQLVAVD